MSFKEYIQEKGYTEEELNILAIELKGGNNNEQ